MEHAAQMRQESEAQVVKAAKESMALQVQAMLSYKSVALQHWTTETTSDKWH